MHNCDTNGQKKKNYYFTFLSRNYNSNCKQKIKLNKKKKI